MSLLVSRLRTVGRRRGVLVFAVSLAVVAAVQAGVVAAGPSPHGIAVRPDGPVSRAPAPAQGSGKRVIVGHSYKNDSSRPVRSLPRSARPVTGFHTEASPNPRPVSRHRDALDAVRQGRRFASRMPGPKLNFDGIPFPGLACACAPPDTNGEAGLTQYVQIVNQGFQVFGKSTGAALTPATDIAALWAGFGGVCEAGGFGDPIVMYDQLANRWLISQFAGTDVPTDECIAISKTSDATGAWWRYGFNLGTHFFDYPHLGVWPDAYYMSMNVFDENPPNDFLGPQPFAFDRAKMLNGDPATFVTITDPSVFNSSNDSMLPADLDGSTTPPAGAPNPFLMSGPFNSTWPLWRFHVDFATPANSTFTVGGTLTPAAYTALCLGQSNCVPQKDVDFADYLDALGDRGMFRLAYRKLGSREALVGNMSVQSNGVAGIRWYEINHATSGTPSFVQQSTYQPDTTWRWMGSVAMDRFGNLALGFSASSPAMHPAIKYAGRLAGDPANTLAQGEATLFAGTGSQQETNNRWGDYSDLTVDPVDDCTFWYTQEYYASTAPFAWRTRIGSFRLHGCAPVFSITTVRNGTGAGAVTSTPAGVSCGATCSAGFDDGTPMTLTATPAVGSVFTGWSGGGCAGTGVCTFVLNGAKTITATFTLQTRHLTVGRKGNGRGTVTSLPGGIGCGGTCSAGFPYGTALTLTAKPTATSVFGGWSGTCAGKGVCSLSLTTDPTATATFKAKCVVPKVLGLTLKKAKARIRRAHCTVGKVTKKASFKRRKGKVLAQKPKPGKRLAPGARVNVTVGRG
jgi:PASTA domain/Divergent InlB B-repeat domain